MKANNRQSHEQNTPRHDHRNEPTRTGRQSGAGEVVVLSSDTFVDEVLNVDMPVLVDFKAEWCGPCKYMAPIVAQLAPEYAGRVKFAKLDVDQSPELADALHIHNIPTLMLFQRDTLLNKGMGAMRPEDLGNWIEEGLARMSSGSEIQGAHTAGVTRAPVQ